MATEIIDLGVVLDEPKQVRLEKGGTVYKLPAQIPVPLYLRIKARQSSEDEDIVEALHQQVLELFQVHQPKMTTIPCGMQQLFEIIPMVYGPESAEGEGRTNGRRGSAKRTNSPNRKRKTSAS